MYHQFQESCELNFKYTNNVTREIRVKLKIKLNTTEGSQSPSHCRSQQVIGPTVSWGFGGDYEYIYNKFLKEKKSNEYEFGIRNLNLNLNLNQMKWNEMKIHFIKIKKFTLTFQP